MSIGSEKVPIGSEKMPIKSEKVPIESEGVPIGNLSTKQRIIFQFMKENGRFIEYNKLAGGLIYVSDSIKHTG